MLHRNLKYYMIWWSKALRPKYVTEQCYHTRILDKWCCVSPTSHEWKTEGKKYCTASRGTVPLILPITEVTLIKTTSGSEAGYHLLGLRQPAQPAHYAAYCLPSSLSQQLASAPSDNFFFFFIICELDFLYLSVVLCRCICACVYISLCLICMSVYWLVCRLSTLWSRGV